MRIHFSISPNSETVPFDYQSLLLKRFHKWLGQNEIHDDISLYSYSWLNGGKISKDGYIFPKGASWFFSAWDEAIIKQLISGVMNDTALFNGMYIKEITMQETPVFGSENKFLVASPVLIRKYDETKKAKHIKYVEPEADILLTETLKRKFTAANLNLDVAVCFDRESTKSKTKLVNINGINNRANMCPVIIKGGAQALQFAWNVGVGHSTGCGFGALY
ncbi:MAG: CRISPR-associated endoribonuclease Cas6 [Ignavibacteriaceae bacterium]|nr:CRISPR-associated endoribonuclease Cas6 [Ignavibacteriaceae bacterium]